MGDPKSWKNSIYPVYVVQALPRDKAALELDGLPTDVAPEVFRQGRCHWWEPDVRSYGLGEIVQLADGSECLGRHIQAGDQLKGKSGRPLRVEATHFVTEGGDDTLSDADDAVKALISVATHRCPGTGKEARSWARLDRRDALHAVATHYLHANVSMCRFRSAAAGDYAADLVFEIDAHDDIPAGCPLEFFHPYIGAAVAVGRRIYDYLVSVRGVDSRYITVSISRMGARVTIDWRAFGPRRLHEILAVLRFIEAQVFADGELAEIAKKYGVPKIELDGRAYSRSDAPRPVDGVNTFIGPWLRPVGALHSKSANAHWWYRTMPVAHERFRPEETAWLVSISRGHDPAKIGQGIPLFTWPEARLPGADKLIEDDPRPAWKLIDLFERDDLASELRDDHQVEVTQARHKATGRRVRHQSAREIDEETVRRFVDLLGVDAREHGDKWQLDCPRPGCKAGGLKAAVYKDGGTFTCFRCSPKGISLWTLAAELGLSSRLPLRQQSSSPVQWIPKEDVPPMRSDPWAALPYVELVEPVCATVQDVWVKRGAEIDKFLARGDARTFVDLSDTGQGKSHTTREKLRVLPYNFRVFAPRDDLKTEYAEALPNAVIVDGRRPGINCVNDELAEVVSRGEPVAQTLCSTCSRRKGCAYYEQLGRAKGKPTILSHAHGPFADFEAFDNASVLDVVDEDALDPDSQVFDLDEREVSLLRARLVFEFEEDDGEEDVSIDTPIVYRRVAATSRIGALVDRLASLLTTDAVVANDVRGGELADAQLGRHLFRDPVLRDAVLAINDEDYNAHDGARLDLQERWQTRAQPLGFTVLPAEEAKWEAPEGLSEEDQIGAWLTWQKSHMAPVEAPSRSVEWRQLHRRPKAVLKALVDALRGLAGGTAGVSPLLAYRPPESGAWVLRLTVRRPFLPNSEKVMVLTATTTPERQQLLLGPPEVDRKWVVFRPRLARKDHRTMIADHSYSKSALLPRSGEPLRARLFETVKALIARERSRTGLPVAVLGPAPIMNLFLADVLGKKEAAKHHLPFTVDRVGKVAALKGVTEPLGFIAGYAYGVAGSNEFYTMEGSQKRFVRSAIVMGNPVPNLGEFARAHRGLFTDFSRYTLDPDGFGIGPRIVEETVAPDWTETYRTVPFAGQEKDGKQLVARNVIGYGDDVANSILAGRYEAEIVQMAGRSRPFLDDPIDPSIQPRAYVFAGVAIPTWEVDEVTGLEELRGQLGLDVVAAKTRGGSKSKKSVTEQVQARVKRDGPAATITWLARTYANLGKSRDGIPTLVRLDFERAGVPFRVPGRSPIQVAIDAVIEATVVAA